jgi:hypothetical protein
MGYRVLLVFAEAVAGGPAVWENDRDSRASTEVAAPRSGNFGVSGMNKKVTFGKRPSAAGEPPESGDAWVTHQSGGDPVDPAEPRKRLRFDVP